MMIDIKNTLSVREKSILRYALAFLLRHLADEAPNLLGRVHKEERVVLLTEIDQLGAEITRIDERLATGLNERDPDGYDDEGKILPWA